MKKLNRIFIVFLAILFISGCTMKAEYNMVIKDDKSMDFTVITAMDDELIEGLLSMQDNSMLQDTSEAPQERVYTDEEKWAIFDSVTAEEGKITPEEAGFKKERYQEGNLKGLKYTKTIPNIDDISGDTANFSFENFQQIGNDILFVKTGNVYKANLLLTTGEKSDNYSNYNVGVNVKFVVTFPTEPISHNATSVSEDGKTLSWNLLEVGSQNIEFEFKLKDNNMLLYILIGGGALLLVIIILLVIKSNKNKIYEPINATINNNPIIPNTVANPVSPQTPSVNPEPPVVSPETSVVSPVTPVVSPVTPVVSPNTSTLSQEPIQTINNDSSFAESSLNDNSQPSQPVNNDLSQATTLDFEQNNGNQNISINNDTN